MLGNRALIVALAISLFGHCLFLFIPRFNFIFSPVKKWRDVVVEIEIEKKPKVTSHTLAGTGKSPITREERIEERRERKEKEEKKIIEVQKPKKTKPQFKRKKVKEPHTTRSPSHPRTASLRGRQITKSPATSKNKKQEIKEKRERKREEEEFLSPIIEEASEVNFVLENGKKEALLRYQDRVKQRIEECKRYPRWAKKQGFEGIVYLGFTILSNGEARDIRITRPSQFDIFNREALATVNRASPFLPIPQDFNRSYVEMEVSVVFRLK